MLLRSVSSRICRPDHALKTHSRRSTLGGSGEIHRALGALGRARRGLRSWRGGRERAQRRGGR
jgi:hypothetical protein